MDKSMLPILAFDILKEAEQLYQESKSFNNEMLENLYSWFGESLLQATELLEKCKVYQYSLPCGLRKMYRISSCSEQYTVFDNINFCQCNTFKTKVLESRNSLSCKHVLAVHLAKITGNISEEIISSNLFEDFLNDQLNCLDNSCDESVL